jgi:hypothetical protein
MIMEGRGDDTVRIVDAQKQARTECDVPDPWVRPKVPREPTDVLDPILTKDGHRLDHDNVVQLAPADNPTIPPSISCNR